MTEWRSLTGPLWFSYVEAVLTSLVVGFAENYFAAFGGKYPQLHFPVEKNAEKLHC